MKRDAPSDAELFRAARVERAPASLRAALLAGRKPKRDWRPLWLGSTYAAAAAVAIVWWGAVPRDVGVAISAERLVPAAPAAVSSYERETPASPAAPPPSDAVSDVAVAAPRESTLAASRQTTARKPPVRDALRQPPSPPRHTLEPPAASVEPSELDAPNPPRASFAEQLDVIKRARAAVRAGNGRDALGLLDRHDDVLRGGGLEAEGRLLRIEALAGSGRSAEARELAQRFIVDYPNSPLAARARGFAQPPPRDQ